MLSFAKNLQALRFSELMEVYREGNLENGSELWPELSAGQQLFQAEAEFLQYLQEVFFPTPGAIYALWTEEGVYVSALRLEPYRDGLLLEALETHPDHRKKGYAGMLIREAARHFSGTRIYSHVGKKNTASLRVHEGCGFQRISEQARYIDGSVNSYCCTLLLENR